MCRHELGTPVTRYDREANRLIHVLVCDECHTPYKETIGAEYKPNFVAHPQPKRCDTP